MSAKRDKENQPINPLLQSTQSFPAPLFGSVERKPKQIEPELDQDVMTYLSCTVDRAYIPALDIIEKKNKLSKSVMYEELLTNFINKHRDLLGREAVKKKARRNTSGGEYLARRKDMTIYMAVGVRKDFEHISKHNRWRTKGDAMDEAVRDYLTEHRNLLERNKINLDRLLAE